MGSRKGVAVGSDHEERPEALRREGETLEPLLEGPGWILQKERGYRFSLDAVVLADFVTRVHRAVGPGRKIRYADLGTGCGVILVLLARWWEGLTGFGVEIQEDLADLAARNLRLHRLQDRFEILHMDLGEMTSRFPAGSFDWITANPPYRRVGTGRLNPDPERASARHELAASLEDYCRVTAHLLRQRGRAFLIYPAERLADLVSALVGAGLEPKVLRFVHPRPERAAVWILVEAVRGGGKGLRVEPPLVVEDSGGRYTEEMQGIFARLSNPSAGRGRS